MLESNLPSPDLGTNGFHLRRIASKNISSLEIAGMGYPSRSHPGAAKLAAFFAACSAAAATIGKAIPALTLTPQASTGVAGSTQQLTVGKGGSSGAVTWSSSNPTVATVNASGLVTRVANGVAIVTATVAEGAAHKAGTVTATIAVA